MVTILLGHFSTLLISTQSIAEVDGNASSFADYKFDLIGINEEFLKFLTEEIYV